MRLYHGTYNENLEAILKSGYLDNTKVAEDTLMVDKDIEKVIGRKLTNNALYLGSNLFSTQISFEYEFALDVDIDLDKDKLFVADYYRRDEIMGYGSDCEEGIKAINDYVKSFVSYDEYINKSLKYESPEFLYFDKVDISHFSDDILNHLEECEDYL